MRLIKVYCVIFLILGLCSLGSDGLFLRLLLRIIALKGALLIGTPIALGSFVIGQGIGFLAGNVAGGYAVLKAAQGYHHARYGGGWAPPVPVPVPVKGHVVSYGKGWDGGYGTKGYSVVTSDTGYVPVKGSGGWGWDSTGIKSYTKGINTGVFFGAAHKGFKDGFHHPYGGTTKFPYFGHSYGGWGRPSVFERISHLLGRNKPKVAHSHHVHDHGHGYGHVHGHGHEHSHVYEAPVVSYGHGYSSAAHYTQPTYGFSDAYLAAPSYHAASESESTVYETPTHEYTVAGDTDTTGYSAAAGAIPAGYSSSVEIPAGYSSADLASVSISPSSSPYSGSDIYTKGETSSFYDLADTPKSEPMDSTYFSQEYESSQPGIGTDELIQAFGGASAYPAKPNDYGTPIADPMGSAEYSSSYGYQPSNSYVSNEHEPLDVQASIAYDVSTAFGRKIAMKKLGEQLKAEESMRSQKTVAAPNAIVEKFLEQKLEEKARKTQSEAEKKGARHLIGLLRKAYMQQLIDSLNKGKSAAERHPDIPEFKPLPAIPNSTTAAPTSQSTTTTTSTSTTSTTPVPSSIETATGSSAEEAKDSKESQERYSKESQETESKSKVDEPKSKESSETGTEYQGRPKRESTDASPTAETLNGAEEPVRMSPQEHEKFVANFVEDVKSFFVLVSALDQDTCLQKLVCDVHTRTGQPDLTTYETNIISTFRIMDTLLPADVEDSSSVYRRAARIGEIGSSPEVCQKSYASCGYTASQIINLGKQVETAEASNLSQMTFGDVENTATAMPRV